jgi:golgi phosphoprotein 3
MLDIFEKMLLIAINEKRSRYFFIASHFLNYGLAGAMVLELVRLGKVSIDNKKVEMIDESSANLEILNTMLRRISENHGHISLNRLIYGNSRIKMASRKTVMRNLVNKGIVYEDEKRFLGLIPIRLYILTHPEARHSAVERIREILLDEEGYGATGRDDIILASLAAVCNISSIFITRSEKRTNRNKLIEISKGSYFDGYGNELQYVLRAVKYAIAAASSS